MRRAELLSYWTPAVLWAAVLLLMSGKEGSADVTGGILQWLLAVTIGPVSDPHFAALHSLIRKSGHLVAYGILGALDFRAIRAGREGWTLRWSAIAVALAVAVAIVDEVHQSMVRGRTGVPGDVIIDWAGAMIAQVILKHETRNANREI